MFEAALFSKQNQRLDTLRGFYHHLENQRPAEQLQSVRIHLDANSYTVLHFQPHANMITKNIIACMVHKGLICKHDHIHVWFDCQKSYKLPYITLYDLIYFFHYSARCTEVDYISHWVTEICVILENMPFLWRLQQKNLVLLRYMFFMES